MHWIEDAGHLLQEDAPAQLLAHLRASDDIVLETFDDPDLARGYRDVVLRSMQRRSLHDRYAVGIRLKHVAGSRQWWVVLRDWTRRPL